MRIAARLAAVLGVLSALALGQAHKGTGTLPLPTVTATTATSFSLSWTTTQKLNTQVWYSLHTGGTPTLGTEYANWTLSTAHAATVGGLAAGATYDVQAESSDYSNPDLVSSVFTITLSGSAAVTRELAPATAALTVGQTQQFTPSYSIDGRGPQRGYAARAAYARPGLGALGPQAGAAPLGAPVGTLTWTVSSGGEISDTGVFTAAETGSFLVTATDANNLQATATVTVTAPVGETGLAVAPQNGVVFVGTNLTFTASYANGSAAPVTWTASNGGTIDPNAGGFSANTAGTFTITATDGSGNTASATLEVLTATAPPTGNACPGCFFTSPAAAWLYAGPTPSWGLGRDLSSVAPGWAAPTLNANNGGFGMPVQETDGGYGTTNVNDYKYGRSDSALMENPAGNQWTVSCGWIPPDSFGKTSCYGAYDGKDFLIDSATGNFWDIDQMYVDGKGHPMNYGPYGYGRGDCGGPGESVCGVRGVFAGNLATSSPALGGSTAAGIVSGAGVIVPGELDCTTCLNHAVQVISSDALDNITTCNAVPTGKNGDGAGKLPQAMLCEGGMLFYSGDWTQLDPSTHSTATIALARALALYGGVITDQGGPSGNTFGFYTDYNAAPATTGIADLLQHLVVFYGTAVLQ